MLLRFSFISLFYRNFVLLKIIFYFCSSDLSSIFVCNGTALPVASSGGDLSKSNGGGLASMEPKFCGGATSGVEAPATETAFYCGANAPDPLTNDSVVSLVAPVAVVGAKPYSPASPV